MLSTRKLHFCSEHEKITIVLLAFLISFLLLLKIKSLAHDSAFFFHLKINEPSSIKSITVSWGCGSWRPRYESKGSLINTKVLKHQRWCGQTDQLKKKGIEGFCITVVLFQPEVQMLNFVRDSSFHTSHINTIILNTYVLCPNELQTFTTQYSPTF